MNVGTASRPTKHKLLLTGGAVIKRPQLPCVPQNMSHQKEKNRILKKCEREREDPEDNQSRDSRSPFENEGEFILKRVTGHLV